MMLLDAQAAQNDWPTKSLKYIVPFAPGGVSDGVGRLIAKHLSDKLGQPVIIENRAGVSGIVGTVAAAQAAPDGYTMIGGTITTHAVNPLFIKALNYDPVKSFEPVAMIGMVSNVLVVSSEGRFKSVQQIIDELKQEPDRLTYGSSGLGTSQHLSGELFQSLTKTHMRQIAYKGGSQAMVDLIGGQVDMVFETVAAAKPMIDNKRATALAVTSLNRVPSLPDVPTLSELGVRNFEMQSWQGVFVPTGTPEHIVQKLGDTLSEILKTPEVREKLLLIGVEPSAIRGSAFRDFQANEIAKWSKVLQDAGVKPE